MKLAVISHKLCSPSESSPTGYVTDGGFPFQMEAISELFDETVIVVPAVERASTQLAPLKGRGMKVTALTVPTGHGLRRKLGFPLWLLSNGKVIWNEVRKSDAVHTPIPGDVGTIGMLFALLLRKPLFVRHCGNWLVQRTIAERFWKWSMEFFGGGRNVMFATGSAADAPSARNPNVKWIFSTSLRESQLIGVEPIRLPADGRFRLVIVCRQEERKGTDVVIESMPEILKAFPLAALDVVGDGSLLGRLKERAMELGVAESITFHGNLAHAKVLKVLSEAHLFCYPTSASEGFPKVVLEALANGIPVITTRVSVLPQLIAAGCGVLLDSATPDDLVPAVIGALTDETRYTQMSERALEVSKQYSLEAWRDVIGESLTRAWIEPLSTEAESAA